MFNKLINFIIKKLTISRGNAEISKTREVLTQPIREVSPSVNSAKPMTDSFACPYCASKDFFRRGFRQKRSERVQLYQCNSCGKTFTPHSAKGKHYPLTTIFDAISLYNLGYSLEEVCEIVNKKRALVSESSSSVGSCIPLSNTRGPNISLTGKNVNNNSIAQKLFMVQPSTLSNWLAEFGDNCRFSRMREFAIKKYSPKEMVITATLAHRQLYRFRFHQAKCELMIQEEFQHRKFRPLKEFLEMVPVECPHQYFQEGLRASETPLTFSKIAMIVRSKQNYATKTAQFVLQSVKERKDRHETLQKFMLYNDSVTVATEVPVYITRDDLEHLKTQLGFEIYIKNQISNIKNTPQNLLGKLAGQANQKLKINNNLVPNLSEVANESLPKDSATIAENDIAEIVNLPKLITGHIDILQIRNGQIHILDYKANAEKERPIEQLTLYAMALSRLTGLRLFEFKCAWFDEKDYFEFYPLHVLHKPNKARRRRQVATQEGIYLVNKEINKIKNIRPTDKYV